MKINPVVIKSSPDGNVEAIRQALLERSIVGFQKYGVTTERGDLSLGDWLQHLQEELLDAAVYVQAAKAQAADTARLDFIAQGASVWQVIDNGVETWTCAYGLDERVTAATMREALDLAMTRGVSHG